MYTSNTYYLFLFALLFTPFSLEYAAAQSSGSGEAWGIFIGIDLTEEGIGNGYSAQNASEAHSLWVQHQQLNPTSSFLLLNDGARREDFREALYRLRTAHPDDRVIVYISSPTQVEFTDSLTAAGHFMPYDGLINLAEDSSARLIPAEELRDAVLTSPAREVLTMIDAPISGLHASGWPPLSYDGLPSTVSDITGKHLLVAGRWGDSFLQNERNQSPFVTSMTTALTTKAADRNQNNQLSFTELSDFIRSDIARQTEGYQSVQVRSYAGSLDFEMPLDKGAAETSPVQEPAATAFSGDSLRIQFDTTPISANVYINDQLIGQTPIAWQAPRWSDVSVHLSAPGYLPWDEVITPDNELYTTRTLHLLEDRALLEISNVPNGHDVWINGAVESTTAIDPLELPTGQYHVMIKKGNKIITDQLITLDPETSTRLTFDRKFNISPIMASFFFPGLGQYTHDARLKGIGFALATFSTLAVAMGHNLTYQNHKDSYFDAQDLYIQARTRPVAHAMRAEMLAQYDKVLEFNDKRFNTLLIAALIQGVGVLDALLFHSRESRLHTEQKTELTPFLGAHESGLQFGIQIKL